MKALTVSEVNRYIKSLIDTDAILENIHVTGEISNFKAHSSGHAYFTLKDSNSSIKCIMFKTYFQKVKFKMENGMKVIIGGKVSVFERDGQYQLYCSQVQPDGLGALYLAFEQLKRRLESFGWFDQRFKKQIPFFPAKIAVVTAPTGAAIKDIINVSTRRYKNVNLVVVPALVQGDGAVESIAKAIRYANAIEDVEVIILARGGGSIEDLWCFNSEIVAQAIFESEIPIVSAVGHEIDYTIADFVSDLRAPTPSAAAEIVVPNYDDIVKKIELMRAKANNSIKHILNNSKNSLKLIQNSRALLEPLNLVYERQMIIDRIKSDMIKLLKTRLLEQKERYIKSYSKIDSKLINIELKRVKLNSINNNLKKTMELRLIDKKHKFRELNSKLDILNPMFMTEKGYSMTYDEQDRIIKDISTVSKDDKIKVVVRNGTLKCTVNDIEGKIDNG